MSGFIAGFDSDTPEDFDELRSFIAESRLLEVQVTVLTPFPGTLDFEKWEASVGDSAQKVDGVPVPRHAKKRLVHVSHRLLGRRRSRRSFDGARNAPGLRRV